MIKPLLSTLLQMQKLELRGCELSDEGLTTMSSCMNNIEELKINLDSSISTEAIRKVAEAITKRKYPVINRNITFHEYRLSQNK